MKTRSRGPCTGEMISYNIPESRSKKSIELRKTAPAEKIERKEKPVHRTPTQQMRNIKHVEDDEVVDERAAQRQRMLKNEMDKLKAKKDDPVPDTDNEDAASSPDSSSSSEQAPEKGEQQEKPSTPAPAEDDDDLIPDHPKDNPAEEEDKVFCDNDAAKTAAESAESAESADDEGGA